MTVLYVDKPEILYSSEDIELKIKSIAQQINADYQNSKNFTVISVLKGSIAFAADIIRYINLPLKLEFVRLESYGTSTSSSGVIKPVDLTLPSLDDSDVLIVEDIVDSGLTAEFFINYLKSHHSVRSVKLAVILDKTVNRTHEVQIDYKCFTLDEDKFVIGYGLDYAGLYRNVPYIGVLSQDAILS